MTYNISAGNLVINLFDGTTDLGRIANFAPTANTAGFTPVKAERFLTPSNASHQFFIKAWKTGAGTASIGAGTGATAAYVPAFLRITS